MLITNVCRCCLADTCFKDISNEYVYKGCNEVYADILLNTFNVRIAYTDSSSRFICEDCIIRLRQAAAFKKQVLRAEEAITKGIDGVDVCNDDNQAKIQEETDDFLDHITGEYEEDSDEELPDDSHGSYGEELDWQSNGFDDDDLDGNIVSIKLEPEDDIPLQILQKSKLLKKITKVNFKRDTIICKNKAKSKAEPRNKQEQRKRIPQYDRKENSLKLLNNSNICLFESLKTRFRCFYCKNSYFNINELREHTNTHSNLSYLKMCINRMQGMSYKCVDISNLACKLCPEQPKDLINLTDLRVHLTQKHEIAFNGEEHMLIPYKLENGFTCVACAQNFNSFFKLSVHMNTHYKNHVCEICGASYINRLSLRMHVNSRHREKKCSICASTFVNAYLRVKHMRKVHNASESKRYCLLCNKTFRYTYMLDEHKIQEHGMKRAVSSCAECGKSFLSPVNLRTHIRCVHIKERNHPCNHCGMSFFTSCDRRRHENTHQDIRLFACTYCDGRFKSKDSMRRHLKRQHGHLHDTGGNTFTHTN